MSEVAFCKSFLSALDARPSKLSSDHIADARQYPAQGAYTLPRLPHPQHPQRPNPPAATTTGSDASTISVTLKPMKPSTPTIPLPNIEPSRTSIYDLKSQYAASTSIPTARIKILYKKKPVTDSKTVAEVIDGRVAGQVEFGVMIMGGVSGGISDPSPTSSLQGTPVTSPPVTAPGEEEKGLAGAGAAALGPSGKEIVATDEFWSDLNNFVLQRTKDEAESQRLLRVFKSAWEQNK